ncbi:phosphate ABC transporter permease PstA [Gorillibacterium sp. sgz500922]|uniref:phosphate ABC transporter permease PstA n=1 Tax=Gorillibacterium sp. sgz500922 TaxID=3446694 RepID=UPI003F671C9F
MSPISQSSAVRRTLNGRRHNRRVRALNRIATACFWALGSLLLLLILWLLFTIVGHGLFRIDGSFLIDMPEELDTGGGIGPVLFNSFYILFLSLVISIPIGIGAGVYLAEYAPPGKSTEFLRVCVEGLASVPSIVFGLLGIAIFVEAFHIGLTILGGAVTLAFLNLPVLTRVTEEAVHAVPQEYRDAAYALGSTKFQCIGRVVLPAALGGIVTGVSLTAGRAFGESAVIILTSGLSTSGRMWDFHLMAPGETLAVHLWYVQSEALVPDARDIADKSAAVLVVVVLLINLVFRFPLWLRARRTR